MKPSYLIPESFLTWEIQRKTQYGKPISLMQISRMAWRIFSRRASSESLLIKLERRLYITARSLRWTSFIGTKSFMRSVGILATGQRAAANRRVLQSLEADQSSPRKRVKLLRWMPTCKLLYLQAAFGWKSH